MYRQLFLAVLALGSVASAQTPINMPPFTTTYVAAATRGFYFTCPVACVITGLQAPNEGARPNQVVEVLDFGTVAPPLFPATQVASSRLFYSNSVAAGTKVNTNIALQAGRVYGIFGACTDGPSSATTYTSYGNGPFTTTIQGQPVILRRLLTQSGIAQNGGNQPCSASTGPIGRVLVDIAPGPGLFADFTANVTSGVSPLTVNFTDTSFTTDPGGITSWAWDFQNDGTIDSTVRNPTHVFPCGTFDVKLTVTAASFPAASRTRFECVNTDVIAPSFTVSLLTPPNVWQFTDTSTGSPQTWSWDFQNDGTVDSTLQNPTYVSPASCLNSTVRLTIGRNCRSVIGLTPTFAANNSFLGATAGGNGLASPTAVGNYFDLGVTATAGIKVCGLRVAPYSIAGPFTARVYVTEVTHAGKEGIATAWRLVGSGTGQSTGGGFLPPSFTNVAINPPFFLPSGNYGMAVFLSGPNGMGIAYTDGPAGPFVGADVTIHPGATGSSSASELGPVAFAPRLWNGGLFYSRCSVTGEAASGFFGTGCPGPLGTPRLDPVGTSPALGTTYRLDVTNVPSGVAVMITSYNHTFSPTFGALPIEGTAYGAPGCFLRMRSDFPMLLLTGSTTATWSFPVPNAVGLTCLPFFNQAAVLSPSSNALGFVLSDARAAVVGH